MDTANNIYPAFQFPASELSAFAVASNIFTISLKNREIIHFHPDDVQDFHNWLMVNGIRDIQTEKTIKPAVAAPRKNWLGCFKRNK